jgi:hypothetical protein
MLDVARTFPLLTALSLDQPLPPPLPPALPPPGADAAAVGAAVGANPLDFPAAQQGPGVILAPAGPVAVQANAAAAAAAAASPAHVPPVGSITAACMAEVVKRLAGLERLSLANARVANDALLELPYARRLRSLCLAGKRCYCHVVPAESQIVSTVALYLQMCAYTAQFFLWCFIRIV